MSQGSLPSYVLAYVISSTIVVGGHQFFNSNPIMSTVIPCRMYQYPESARDYYCYWYSACPQWCKYLIVPNAFDSVPRSSAPLPYRNRQLQHSRPPTYSAMLDNTNLAVLARLLDNYLISKDFIAKRTYTNNMPQTTISGLKKINEPVKTITYSKLIEYVTKNTSKSGRRTELTDIFNGISIPKGGAPLSIIPNISQLHNNVHNTTNIFLNTSLVSTSVPWDSQPPVLPQITIDHVPNTTSPVSTSVEVITESIKLETNTSTIKQQHVNETVPDRSSANETAETNNQKRGDFLFRKFRATLDQVERKFLVSAFTKLTAICPENRKENGISFLQSGFLLHQLLLALSIEAGQNVTREIEECLGLDISKEDKVEMLERASLLLPKSSDVLKFRWSSRLVLRPSMDVSGGTQRAARAARLQLSWLNGTETAAELAQDLNKRVELDSGGSMHDTFDEEEFSTGACAAAMGTGYVRATWRAAPTLLNDSLPFRDAPQAPNRTSRFFRLNDVMGYAYLHEWDAEAIEIPYATPGLTLLLLVPKEPSLRPLVERVSQRTLDRVLGVMGPVRLAVTLPLYTLRMTLLLPNKLEDMGIPSLLQANDTDCDSLKFSHAVQRLMFWAEAGRNAFKDDGIEWDPHPELEIVVDRPYLFFVRWQNITIMNGAFVL